MLSDPKCIETISLTGGVNALIEQLEVDDTELQLGSMKLLSALSIDSLPPPPRLSSYLHLEKNKTLITNSGVVPKVVQLLRAESPELQEHAAFVLCHLSDDGSLIFVGRECF